MVCNLGAKNYLTPAGGLNEVGVTSFLGIKQGDLEKSSLLLFSIVGSLTPKSHREHCKVNFEDFEILPFP
jgi:hypothetical protein